MGNAHVTNVKRMGVRSGPGAETRWVELGDGYEFNPSDGIAPAQLVAELHVDKTIKLENTRFQWVAEDTFAAPIDFVLAETSVPLVMETLTTYCSLPRAWPSGQYRVDVFLGSSSESDGSLKFRIRETDHQMANATLTRTSDGSVVEDTIQRGDGPLRIVFESGFMCHVRKESFIEWIRGDDHLLIKLAVPVGTYDRFHSDISLDQLWPAPCDFQVRLLLDGQLAHVKRFSSVDGWFCVLEPQVPSCNCGAIVATFSHGAVVHAENGMEIVWKYLGNEETEIARVPLPAGDHNEATSTCRIGENPWPAGLYKVTLLANGVVLCTKDFEVK